MFPSPTSLLAIHILLVDESKRQSNRLQLKEGGRLGVDRLRWNERREKGWEGHSQRFTCIDCWEVNDGIGSHLLLKPMDGTASNRSSQKKQTSRGSERLRCKGLEPKRRMQGCGWIDWTERRAGCRKRIGAKHENGCLPNARVLKNGSIEAKSSYYAFPSSNGRYESENEIFLQDRLRRYWILY